MARSGSLFIRPLMAISFTSSSSTCSGSICWPADWRISTSSVLQYSTHFDFGYDFCSCSSVESNCARWYYPYMMKGEWPVLLDILGKGDGEARYLSVAEVRTLFVDRQLPDRIAARLPVP